MHSLDYVVARVCLSLRLSICHFSKHPLHYLLPLVICYLLLKYLIVRWFCGLHIHIKFHWPKLHVMEQTFYNIALPISFSSAV